MEFAEVVRKRRMCRAYTDEDIPEDLVERLLDLGARFPSAGHTQPQEFIVIRTPEQKLALGRAAFDQVWMAEAPVIFAVVSDTRRSAQHYGRRGRDFYSIVDGAFASMLILLSAVDLGLGAAFVAAFDDDEVSQVLDLPAHVRPIGLISIGHCAEPAHRITRRPRQDLIHQERYDHDRAR